MKRVMIFGVMCGWAFSAAVLAQGPALLVVNQTDSDVSVVDPVAGRQVATVADGSKGIWGHEIAVSPDGKRAFVPIYGSAGVGRPGLNGRSMQVIDVASRKVVGEVDFGHEVRPHLPVMDTVSGLLYVTTELDNSITIVDPKTLKVMGSVPTGQAQSHMLAVSHDGRRGYTANVAAGTISVLDLAGRKTLQVVPVVTDPVGAKGWRVQRIAISPDDKLVFTADQTKPELVVFDTATNAVKTRVTLPGLAYGTAATADGRWLLATILTTNQIAVVDLRSMKVVRSIDVPKVPQEVLIRPDGKVAYVSCNESGEVAAIDLAGDVAQWKMGKVIAVGKFADGLAWVP